MSDLIVIGSGPAGATAAIYALRAGFSAAVISMGAGSLARAEKIENYYALPALSGAELHAAGEAQARAFGAELIGGEVVGMSYDGSVFEAVTADGRTFSARAAVLATGMLRRSPDIKGLSALEGRGVSWCAVCDGFFYRKKEVCVLGAGEYAAHEAAVLLPLAASVTILTNGEEPDFDAPEGAAVDKRRIAALEGGDKLAGVRFDDGAALAADGLFIALGTAGSVSLARTLGALTDGRSITVDAGMACSIPGLFAAGDCTGGLPQVVKAAADGAIAGSSASKYLRGLKKA